MPSPNSPTKCVFISYKRNVAPDHQVATAVHTALANQPNLNVFIDQVMLPGEKWGQRIEEELRQSDFVITFLSAAAVRSEMVQAEIETAFELSKQNPEGKPHIIPVRLAYKEAFTYPLSAFLDPINWAMWSSDADTPGLIAQLIQAIHAGELQEDQAAREIVASPEVEGTIPAPSAAAQPLTYQPEAVGGTMPSESKFYIQRPEDNAALVLYQLPNFTLSIQGPRQMGKSSLLSRFLNEAGKHNQIPAMIDFQIFDKAALANADTFYYQFATRLARELRIQVKVSEHWDTMLGNNQRCTDFVEEFILPAVDRPIVLAMDEVERVFDSPFRDDFFSMLRTWHNNRNLINRAVWKQLNLALVTSTEPNNFIESMNMSPFNVSTPVHLTDFTPQQVQELNELHVKPFNANQLPQLVDMLHGQPFLTRRALYAVKVEGMTPDALLQQPDLDSGPFGDHLRNHLFRMSTFPDLAEAMRQIIRYQTCQGTTLCARLEGAGLVRREGNNFVPRCKLYADYFGRRL